MSEQCVQHSKSAFVRPDIFSFKSSCDYLRAFYHYKKAQRVPFSFTLLARKVGVCRSYFRMVMGGKRALNPELIPKIAQICGLSDWETKYFIALVQWEAMKDSALKAKAWEQVAKIGSRSQYTVLTQEQHILLASSIVPAVKELVELADFREDYQWMSERLGGVVPADHIEKIFNTLFAAGALVRQGNRVMTDDTITIVRPTEIPRELILKYHKDNIEMAARSMDEVKKELREIVGATISIPEERIDRFRELVREFRNEVLELANEYETCNEVYQLNVQLFPLTRPVTQKVGS